VAKREASGLSSEYIRVQSGNATCLATAEEVPAFFYPAERIDSPFRRVLDSVFVLDGLRIEPGFWPAIPEAYRAERERRARVRLVERLPAAQSGGASLARFEQVSGAPLEPLDRLWWEGETCTFVRASVREIGPKGVLAALDLPRGMSEETLEIGTTFSRLPRLE
jgi:hypothetical protein